MKRLLFLIASLMALNSAMAFDACMTGSWYAPEQNGEGVNIEVFETGRVVGYFYTFGFGGQRWLTLHGRDEGTGEIFLDMRESAAQGVHYSVGEAVITEIDDDSFQFTFYTEVDLSQDTAIPWCLNNKCSGDYTYVRLTQPIPCEVQ